jgi:hypothetical protein
MTEQEFDLLEAILRIDYSKLAVCEQGDAGEE